MVGGDLAEATERQLAEQLGMLVVDYVARAGLLTWHTADKLTLQYFGQHAWWLWEGRPIHRALIARA